MRDLVLQCAGVAGIAVALIHGVLGETKVFAKATIEPESLRTLIRLVWQAGTVAWIGGAVLLIAAPSMGSESAWSCYPTGSWSTPPTVTPRRPQCTSAISHRAVCWCGAARWRTCSFC